MKSKIKLAILFGGRAVEHEISIITGLQLIKAIDYSKYDVSPIYIAPNGKWYSGEALFDKSRLYVPSFDRFKDWATP